MSELEIMNIMDTINYGFNSTKDFEDYFYNDYYLLPPEELLEKKYGVCFDQVELERQLLNRIGIEVYSYFIALIDENNFLTHTFVAYYKNNKYIWFEHSWNTYKGIHEYNSLEELLIDVKNKFIYSHKNELKQTYLFKMYKYNRPNYKLNYKEYYDYIFNSEIIDI